jgi:hypothetical protein
VHAQVSTTLSYGEDAGTAGAKNGEGLDADGSASSSQIADANQKVAENISKDKAAATVETSATAGRAETPPPPPAPSSGDVFHAIRHFFKKLFGGH